MTDAPFIDNTVLPYAEPDKYAASYRDYSHTEYMAYVPSQYREDSNWEERPRKNQKDAEKFVYWINQRAEHAGLTIRAEVRARDVYVTGWRIA